MLIQLEECTDFFIVYCNISLNSISSKMYSLIIFILSQTSKIYGSSGNTLKYNDCNNYVCIYFFFLMKQRQKIDNTDGIKY